MHDHATDGSAADFNRAATARQLRLHLDNAHDARTRGWDHARLAEDHRARHMAEAERLAAERLAAAPPAVIDSVLAEDLWVPQEPVDVVRDALLAEVEPMSFTGKALFILDCLAAAGYEVNLSERSQLSERSHRASDPPGERPVPTTVDALPAAPSSTAAPLLGTGTAGAAVGPNVGGGEPPSPCPAERRAPSGPIRGEWTI